MENKLPKVQKVERKYGAKHIDEILDLIDKALEANSTLFPQPVPIIVPSIPSGSQLGR